MFISKTWCNSFRGIDISDAAIEKAKIEAKKINLEIVYFQEMDAESLKMNDSYFDIIYGKSILHHLNLKKALIQIIRILKPKGRGVFIESLGLNPFINLYRYLTHAMRTKEGYP